MAKRLGKTVVLKNRIGVAAGAGVVGKKEGDGPLADCFDEIVLDDRFGKKSWEKAESELLRRTVEIALEKANKGTADVHAIFAGDLLNQCTGSSFGLCGMNIPFSGVYGACSTMVLSLIQATTAIESGSCSLCVAATGSHFCSAEKQFRLPLEYGGQRTPTAQWTVTGAGAAVLMRDADNECKTCVTAFHMGTITDKGITDAANMGAAMAPAAAETISGFLRDTGTAPGDYDLILTGDLGLVGTKLLYELLQKEHSLDIAAVHNDCGIMMFDRLRQDVHAGGSGCGCCASVLCTKILGELNSGKLKRVLVTATGALMSPLSALQGESIPGIAHAVLLENKTVN